MHKIRRMGCFHTIEWQYFQIQCGDGFHSRLLRHTTRNELTKDFSDIDGADGRPERRILKPFCATLVLEYRENGGGVKQIGSITHSPPLDSFPQAVHRQGNVSRAKCTGLPVPALVVIPVPLFPRLASR